MRIQNNKTKTIAVILTSLTIGMIILSPLTIIPNVSAQQYSGNAKTYDLTTLKPWQVMTPFGPLNRTSVHQYNGTMVDGDAILKKLGVDIHQSNKNINSPPSTNGWNEFGYWNYPSGQYANSFVGNWNVPSNPASSYSSSQVLYLFTGLQDSPVTTIIQPVLQYGTTSLNGSPPYPGGNYWQIVSWMCVGTGCNGGAYWSSPKTVSATDTIQGSLTQYSGQIWTITTKDVSTGVSTSEQLNTSVNFSNADVTLESYNLPSQCSYLSGNAYFTSLSLDSGFTIPNWITGTNTGYWCNMNPVKVSSSEVDLHTLS